MDDAEVNDMGDATPVKCRDLIWSESQECFSEEVTVALAQKEERKLRGWRQSTGGGARYSRSCGLEEREVGSGWSTEKEETQWGCTHQRETDTPLTSPSSLGLSSGVPFSGKPLAALPSPKSEVPSLWNCSLLIFASLAPFTGSDTT